MKATKPTGKFGKSEYATIGLCTAALITAAVMFRSCKPTPEPIQTTCPPPVAVEPGPVRGDNRCEITKGEHDVWSATFDPGSCGYCGDQDNKAPGHNTQPWETPDNCPVDFHCGNGRIDRNVAYPAIIAPSASGGVYTLGTITINESCNPRDANYCEADCGNRAPAGSGHATVRPVPSGDNPIPVVVPPSGGECAGEITQRLLPSFFGGLARNRDAVNNAAGNTNPASIPVRANVRFSISNGSVTVQSVTLSCQGCAGGSFPASSINASGVSVGSVTCNNTISVTLPPGG